MNNVMRRSNSTLINLSQIEGGLELLEKLNELQSIMYEIDLSKYRLKSQYIEEEDLNPIIVKNLFTNVVNSLLNESGSLKTINDILLDIQNIKIVLDTCKKYNEPLSNGEIESVSKSIINDLLKIIETQADKERQEVDEKLETLREELELKMDKVTEVNETIHFQLGDMTELHPFLKEALGPNLTVTDAVNFIFQMLIDTKSYGEELPNTVSDNVYPSIYDGERVEYGEFPKVFEMPNEMGEVGRYSQSETIEELEDNDFGSISERIMYRKTLKKLNEDKE